MQRILLLPLVLISFLVVLPGAGAQDLLQKKTYWFGTHPARTNVTFVSEADLETIHGISHEIHGSIQVDEKGTTATGALRVPVTSMHTGIELRDHHLQSDRWLDAAKYPDIRLDDIEAHQGKEPRAWTFKAKLTIKGVSRNLATDAKVRAIPDDVGKILGKGSWVRVRASFPVTLSDFGIAIPQIVGAKVSRTWQVAVDLYGTTVKPETKHEEAK